MNPERWKLVKKIFGSTLETPRTRREAHLQAACRGDEDLRREVEEMLASHESGGDFLEPEPIELPSTISLPDRILAPSFAAGKVFGSYRILRKLGEGGMGIVYLGEEEEHGRRVALKLVRSHFSSPTERRRFAQEAKILGRLDHPGIAKIYEAGAVEVEDGPQPFLAMEFVEGKPLLEFARERRLGIRERLALIAKVCEAVHHAHQKGVIHRDLKPANILVDNSGQPKVLDFGVARMVEDENLITTLQTGDGQILGTLPYMSPEQIGGESEQIDIRTDIYSLGAIAYELLSGSLPLDLDHKSIPEAVRRVADEEPKLLSSHDHILSGDIETLVAKAIEKERERRYQSALDFASDIQRYLRDEPISARPASAIYHLRKFSKRHKAFVGVSATVFISLLVAIWVVVGERDRALHAQKFAEQRLKDTRTVRDFIRDILTSAGSSEKGPDVTVRELLDHAARRIENGYERRPMFQAEMRCTIGTSYQSLGLDEEAEPHLQKGAELFRAVLGWDNPTTVDAEGKLALTLAKLGRQDEAQALLEHTVSMMRSLYAEDDPRVAFYVNKLGALLHRRGDLERAEPLYREALDLSLRQFGDDHRQTGLRMNNLATLYRQMGRFEEAESLSCKAAEILTEPSSSAPRSPRRAAVRD